MRPKIDCKAAWQPSRFVHRLTAIFPLLIVAIILSYNVQPTSASAQTQLISLIPKPTHLILRSGSYTLQPDTSIAVNDSTHSLGQTLQAVLEPATGFHFKLLDHNSHSAGIQLQIDPTLSPLGREGYRLQITPEKILISSSAPPGIFYGIQTLRQLFPTQIFSPEKVDGISWSIPCAEIEDSPRFPWRGLMLDCSRHFMPKDFIKRFIDLLAIHKMNTFQWHLTDDQGWRIEIKRYPKLTAIGGWRTQTLVGRAGDKPEKFDGQRYGGFYTQDDIREIVKYAAERYVTIVPEIEIPGHSSAAIAAYPELGATSHPVETATSWGVHPDILNPLPATIDFYKNVFSEVIDLFPSPYIHIGCDEVPMTEWDSNLEIQTQLHHLGLKNNLELEQHFIRQIDEFLQSKGRRAVGWDEILTLGMPADMTVMFWHNMDGALAAIRSGHDILMAPRQFTYLNYYQAKDGAGEPLGKGYLPLQQVYAFEPLPPGTGSSDAAKVLGVQGQIWTEYIPKPDLVEYMAYPRACALAEIGWSQPGGKDYAEFLTRLNVHLGRLEELKANYRPPRFTDRPLSSIGN